MADLCLDVSYGYTASASTEPIGPRFLRITDIQGGRFDWSMVPYCEASENDAQKYKLDLGDIVLELEPLVPGGGGTRESEPADDRERLNIRVGSRIHDMERSLIEATLDYFEGNKRRAADALGCSLKTLYNKLNGYSQNQECANS